MMRHKAVSLKAAQQLHILDHDCVYRTTARNPIVFRCHFFSSLSKLAGMDYFGLR